MPHIPTTIPDHPAERHGIVLLVANSSAEVSTVSHSRSFVAVVEVGELKTSVLELVVAVVMSASSSRHHSRHQ
jgi:hypothetical protein